MPPHLVLVGGPELTINSTLTALVAKADCAIETRTWVAVGGTGKLHTAVVDTWSKTQENVTLAGIKILLVFAVVDT